MGNSVTKVVCNKNTTKFNNFKARDIDDDRIKKFIDVFNDLYTEKICEGNTMEILIDRTLGPENDPKPAFKKFKEDNNLTTDEIKNLISSLADMNRADMCPTEQTTSGYNGPVTNNGVCYLIVIVIVIFVTIRIQKNGKLF